MAESKGAQLRKKKKQEVGKLNDIVTYLESSATTDSQRKWAETIKIQIQDRITLLSKALSEWERNR